MKPAIRHLDEHGRHAPAQSRAAKAMRSDNVVQFRKPPMLSHAPAPMGMVDHTGGASGFSKRGPVKVHVRRVVRHKLKSQRTKLSRSAEASKHRALKRQQTVLTKKAAAEAKNAVRRERMRLRKKIPEASARIVKAVKPLSAKEWGELKEGLADWRQRNAPGWRGKVARWQYKRKLDKQDWQRARDREFNPRPF
jgi:hypothetical protein